MTPVDVTDACCILVRDAFDAFHSSQWADKKYLRDGAIARLFGLSRALNVLGWAGTNEFDLMSLFSELVAQHPRPVKIMEGEREDWRADMVQITVQLCEWDRAVRAAERDRMTSAFVDLKERGL